MTRRSQWSVTCDTLAVRLHTPGQTHFFPCAPVVTVLSVIGLVWLLTSAGFSYVANRAVQTAAPS